MEMRIRLICGICMAAAGALSSFPFWVDVEGPVSAAAIAMMAVIGALFGAFLLALVVGRDSNFLRVAVVGALCAPLPMPLAVVLAAALDSSFSFFPDISKLFELLVAALVGPIFFVLYYWWVILPLGALAGILSQLLCTQGNQPSVMSGDDDGVVPD